MNMKMCCACKESKSLEFFHNRKDSSDLKDYKCKVCKKTWHDKNYVPKRNKPAKTKEEYAAEHRNRYALDPEKYKEINKKWLVKNKEKRAKYARFYLAKRRALVNLATFSEYLPEIRKIYENCPKGYHVDHIMPLKGKNLCGLHVPWNLQYLPAEANLKKGNKVE